MTDLPRRQPGENGPDNPHATTQRITSPRFAQGGYVPGRANTDDINVERIRERWEAHKDDPPIVLPQGDVLTFDTGDHPPWNGFDTFLRRALMIGANILVWVLIGFGVVTIATGAWALSQLNDRPSTVYQDDGLINTDEPLIPRDLAPTLDADGYGCDPDVGEC